MAVGLIDKYTKATLSNLFVGDALSMPVHWYYNPGDIVRQFGTMGVQDMQAASEHHPSSIMVLHSTKAGGRRAVEGRNAEQEVVGNVILKGKRDLWGRKGTHYHHGMPAGENTLNAWWARELMQYLLEENGYSLETWTQRYIDFMTAEPARHPDTYAESCHRGFFANWVSGKHPLKCGAVTHDTPSMGALVTVAPLVIALRNTHSQNELKQVCRDHVGLTHPDQGLLLVVDAYVDLLLSLLVRTGDSDTVVPLIQTAMNVTGRTDLSAMLQNKRGDAAIVGGRYSLACYISDSWPSVCYLGAKYFATPSKALIINTNLGGENAHRGAVLGTVVGAASGEVPTDLYQQLAHKQELESLIDRFLIQFSI